MKNTHRLLVALLATLGASTAMAQSSVTLYGRVNTTLEHQKLDGAVPSSTLNGMFNNASRFGFKGVEDLGGGLKAGFQLESGFSGDTGTAGTPFFGRQSEVNLSGGFGMVRAGRFTAESYFATADYVSLHNHDTGSSSDALYAYVMRDANKLAYRTPSMGGFTLEGGMSLHEQTSGGKHAYDLAANYEIGAVALGAGYSKLDQQQQLALRAMYTGGPFMVGGYYQRDKNGYVVNGGKRDTVRLAAAYTMGASEFHANVGRAGSYKNLSNSGAMQYTLGYNYNLSKRTKVYGYYTHVDNKANAAYMTGAAGVDFSSLAVGVRHNF